MSRITLATSIHISQIMAVILQISKAMKIMHISQAMEVIHPRTNQAMEVTPTNQAMVLSPTNQVVAMGHVQRKLPNSLQWLIKLLGRCFCLNPMEIYWQRNIKTSNQKVDIPWNYQSWRRDRLISTKRSFAQFIWKELGEKSDWGPFMKFNKWLIVWEMNVFKGCTIKEPIWR